MKDPKVILKKDFLERRKKDETIPSELR